jgi:hypothetical protein
VLQADDDSHEGVIAFESRQFKTVVKNYSVHDEEILAMECTLVKFRAHLLGERAFGIFIDYASL